MNKGTDNFKNAIYRYLETYAKEDSLFAVSFKSENKNIDDCITYILNTVKNSGVNGFADEEIYGMAIHYYDEEKIEVGSSVSANVIVNHIVELTEEEKIEIKQKAIDDFARAKEEAKLKVRNTFLHKAVSQNKNQSNSTNQGSLF